MVETTALFGGAAIIGILAAFWKYIKAFLYKIVGLFIVNIKFHDCLGKAVVAYCYKNYQKYSIGLGYFSCFQEHIKPKRRTQLVAFEDLTRKFTIFRKKIVPIIIGNSVSSGTNNTPTIENCVSLTFIRGTINIEQLIINAVDFYNNKSEENTKENKRFRISRYAGYGSISSKKYQNGDSTGGQLSGAAFPADAPSPAARDNLWFSLGDKKILKWEIGDIGSDVKLTNNSSAFEMLAFPKIVTEFYEEIKKWKNSEQWYKEKGIAWRRGFLLSGKPGTGKSSLIRAIGYDLDLPIFSFDISTMSNNEFIKFWSQAKNSAPCIILIEDIDAVFEKRENKLGECGGGLTFDCLLNCVGGIENNDGVFLVITTNNIDLLDEAIGVVRKDKDPNGSMISTRPGRIDRVLELKSPDKECRKKIANRILEDYPNFIEEIVEKGDGDSAAQFTERCTQIALKEYWKDRDYL